MIVQKEPNFDHHSFHPSATRRVTTGTEIKFTTSHMESGTEYTTFDKFWMYADIVKEHNALDTCMTIYAIMQKIKSSNSNLILDSDNSVNSILARWGGIDNLLEHFRPYVTKNEVFDIITTRDLDHTLKITKLYGLLCSMELEFDIRVYRVMRTAGWVSVTKNKSIYGGKNSDIMRKCFASCLRYFEAMILFIRKESVSSQDKVNSMLTYKNHINEIIGKSIQSIDQRIMVGGVPSVYCTLVHGFMSWSHAENQTKDRLLHANERKVLN